METLQWFHTVHLKDICLGTEVYYFMYLTSLQRLSEPIPSSHSSHFQCLDILFSKAKVKHWKSCARLYSSSFTF